MGAFLQSAKRDFDLTSFEDQLQYLSSKPYRLSPVRRMEFRTGSNQLDPSRQDYALRLNPANPWEIKRTNAYYDQYGTVLSTKRALAMKEALMVRYKLIIDFLYNNAMKDLREEDQTLINRQVSILERQQNSEFFNGDNYVDLKLDQMDHAVAVEEAIFERDNQLLKMAEVYPEIKQQHVDWTYDSILSVNQVERIVDSLFNLEATPTVVTYRQNQVDLANREYELEKSNVNIGFLQTQYEHYRIEQDRKPWNISMGFVIPISNPNKADMTKRKLEVIAAEHNRDATFLEVEQDRMTSREELKNLISRYRALQENISALHVGPLAQTLSNLNNENPMAIVRFNGNLLKLKAIQIKMRQRILNAYVELLGHVDALQAQPVVNYLSPSLYPIAW